jgi:hypothetical protein
MLLSFYCLNIKPVSYSELSMPKKEPVQSVNHVTSNTTDLRQITNNVFSACNVENDSFGNALTSKNVTNFPGSISGFRKVIPSEDSHSFLDTAHLKSSKLKIIGLPNFQSATPIFPKSSTSSMMVRISDGTTALSPS